jgi:sulfur-carrier protein
MRTNILFFGRLADRMGRDVIADLPDEGCTVAELRRLLSDRHPHAAAELARPSVRACVDQEIVPETCIIRPGQEIAFIPPVSGG